MWAVNGDERYNLTGQTEMRNEIERVVDAWSLSARAACEATQGYVALRMNLRHSWRRVGDA